MTDARGIVLALALSLALHAGVAAALRGLGLGPTATDEDLPALYVELREPVVATGLSGPEGPPTSASPARQGTPAAPPDNAVPAPPLPASRRSASLALSLPPRLLPSAPPAHVPTPAPESSPSSPPPPTIAPPPVMPPPLIAPDARPAAPLAPSRLVIGGPPKRAERMLAPGGDAVSVARADSSGSSAAGAPAAPARTAHAGEPDPGRRPDVSRTTGGPAAAPEAVGARFGSDAAVRGGTERAALSEGRDGAAPPEYDDYVRALRRRIQERLEYPWLAVRRGLQGTIDLLVEVDARGDLMEVLVLSGAESNLLRDAATRAVRDATPFPLPPGLDTRGLRIRLPVVFELK